MIRAHLMGYLKFMNGNVVDANNDAEVNQQLYGYSDLLIACQDEVAFSIVSRSITNDLPLGCLFTAWTALTARYNPTNGASMVRLKRRFTNLSLSPTQDPALWIMECEELKNKVEPNMDDTAFLTHLISHLPEQYDDVANLLEHKLFSTVDPLDLNTFRMLVCTKYDRATSKTKNIGVAYIAKEESQQDKPKCGHCGKTGHGVDRCWDKNPSLKPTCKYCNKAGHTAKRCHKKRKDKEAQKNGEDKKEEYTKEPSEGMSFVCVSDGHEEKKVNRHFWIADSGASVHLTGQELPLTNRRTTDMIIKTGDGTVHQVNYIGDLVGDFVGSN